MDASKQTIKFDGKKPNFLKLCQNQFLLHLSSDHKLEKQKVCLKLSHWHAKNLDNWISCVVARGVQEIDLCLSEKKDSASNDDDVDGNHIRGKYYTFKFTS